MKAKTAKPTSVRSYVQRLESLVDAAKKLNTTFDLDELLSVILSLATKNLGAERGTIYLVNERTKEVWSQVSKGKGVDEIRMPVGTGISGTVAKTGRTINLKDVSKDKRFHAEYDRKSGFQTRNMLCVPMKNWEGRIIGVFQIMNKKQGAFNARDELFLKAFSEHVALAIESTRLHKVILAHERIAREIQIAAEMQQRLLPTELARISMYDLVAAAQPCTSIGGDFYDIIPLGEGRFALTMADVSGKGIPAAMLVSTLHASLRAHLQYPMELTDLVAKLNCLVYRNSQADQFITLFLMILDSVNHTCSYVNAGHNPPYLFRRDQSEIVDLPATGLPLGVLEHSTYEARRFHLFSNDLLVMYTDGITEATREDLELYGEGRMRECILRNRGASIGELKESLLNEVREFVGENPASDDLTLLLLRNLQRV